MGEKVPRPCARCAKAGAAGHPPVARPTVRAVRSVVTEPVGGEDAANAGVGRMMAAAVSVNGQTVKALG